MGTTSTSDRRLFKRLPPVPRKKILEYLQDPSLEAWRLVRGIHVSHGQTLEEVVDLVDLCWPGHFPSTILVARASRLVDRRDKDCELMEDAFR